MKVNIKGYQAIKDTTIEVNPGITAIVGPTNSGKSSIIRAIKGAINNQSGTNFINYDMDESIVEIIEKDNKISWIKAKRGPAKYIINGEEINKIGRSQNEEVAELINMEEIDVGGTNFRLNFWDQMEKAFLMDRTPNQLFNFISQSKEQDLVNDLSNIKSVEQTELTKEINNKLIKLDILKTDVQKLTSDIENLKPFKEFDLDTFEQLINIENQIKIKNNSRANLETNVANLEQDLINKNKQISKLEKIDIKLTNIIEEIGKLKEYLNKIMFKKDNLINTKEYINSKEIELKELNNKEKANNEALRLLEHKIKDIEKYSKLQTEIKGIISKHSVAQNNIKEAQQNIINLNEQTKEYENELNNFEICPFCESDLSKGNHKH